MKARRRWILVLSAALFVVLWGGAMLARLYLRAYRIPTGAMMPNLLPGDYIYARVREAGGDYHPQQGDIIVFRYPGDASLTYVFRCVAEAGDTVVVHDGIMRVNGLVYESALDDPNADHGCVGTGGADCPEPHTIHDQAARGRSPRGLEYGPHVVPAAHVFVAGDNRYNSKDSRYWGPLPESHVLGQVKFIYWSRKPGRIFQRVR